MYHKFVIAPGDLLHDSLTGVLTSKVERLIVEREGPSRELFEKWHSSVKKELKIPPSLMQKHPELIAKMETAVKEMLWNGWHAREPEIVLLELQRKAGDEMATRFETLIKRNEELEAENKQLRWTIDHVLESEAKAP